MSSSKFRLEEDGAHVLCHGDGISFRARIFWDWPVVYLGADAVEKRTGDEWTMAEEELRASTLERMIHFLQTRSPLVVTEYAGGKASSAREREAQRLRSKFEIVRAAPDERENDG